MASRHVDALADESLDSLIEESLALIEAQREFLDADE